MIKSPLSEILANSGAVFDPSSKRFHVSSFGAFEQEYDALNSSTGIRDLSSEGIIECTGDDALDFLHRISTNDLRNINEGMAVRTIFTTENGRIIDAATLLHLGGSILSIGSSVHEFRLLQWLEKYIIVDDVAVSVGYGRFVLLEIIGPGADTFVHAVSGCPPKDAVPNRFIPFEFEQVAATAVKLPLPVSAHRYWIITTADNGPPLFKKFLDHKSELGFMLVGNDAYEVFRIEQGIPTAPNELNDQHNPHEACLLDDVSFTKGCYIGQEVIARLDTYRKVQRRLRGLVFEENDIHAEIYRLHTPDDKTAGDITSYTYSPRMKKHIGLGYVKNKYDKKGTHLLARSDGMTREVRVTDIPFSV